MLALLTLLREDSPRQSVLHELGNFVHRRRNEGRVHQYMRRVKKFADDYGKKGNEPLHTRLLFSEVQIADAMDEGLRRHGLAPFSREREPGAIPPAQARSRQVQSVMLSTLQHVGLLYGRSEFGRMELWITPTAFQLMGVVIIPARRSGNNFLVTAVLEVGNDFCPVPTGESHFRPLGIWRIFVEAGHTRLHGDWAVRLLHGADSGDAP